MTLTYSQGEMHIQIHQIPERLVEIIRTPLFLKMFVSVSKKDNQYRIPANQAALFQEYINEKMNRLSCSLYDENIIKLVLGNYALNSFESGDSTDDFFKIMDRVCAGLNKAKIYEKIWKTGLVYEGIQGIKFYHKAFQEFFVAMVLSTWERDILVGWLDSNAMKEKSDEVICYLTGIISNRTEQNFVLDYLETHNLRLYIKALKSRRNFESVEMDLNYEYAQSYYAQVLHTYDTIIQTYFYKIRHVFDGYNTEGVGKICIRGDMSFAKKSISMIIYNGTLEAKRLDVTMSEDNSAHTVGKNKTEIPINASVITVRHLHARYYNLGLLSYGFDSSREIAVDIIKQQIKEMLKGKRVFDMEIDVLLAEQIEKELKILRNKIGSKNAGKDLSLYTGDINKVICKINGLGLCSHDADNVMARCNVLGHRMNNAESLLDIKADLPLAEGRHAYRFDELYSDEQLVKKIERILLLSNEAIHKIITDIIPVLSTVGSITRKIGVVYRKEGSAGVSYIRVKIQKDEDLTPIIEFRENPVDVYPELDRYYVDKLGQIGKSKESVVGLTSSVLFVYFGDGVFHDQIYGEVEDRFNELFGNL